MSSIVYGGLDVHQDAIVGSPQRLSGSSSQLLGPGLEGL